MASPVPLICKAVILGDVLVGGRGNLSPYAFLASPLMSQPTRWGVYTLMSRLKEQCNRALHGHRQYMQFAYPGSKVPLVAAGLDITIAGWSDSFGTMTGAVASLQADGTFTVDRIDHACAAPDIWGAEEMPDMSTVEAMATATEAQMEGFAASDPDASIGGQAVFYQLAPTEIRQLAPVSLL